MKKITFFITGMNLGGAERVMATLANKFVLENYKVNVVTLKSANSSYELDERINFIGADLVNTPSMLGKIGNAVKSIYFFRRHVQHEKPDIVISFLTNSNIVAVVSRLIFNLKCKIIISERADPRVRSKILQTICSYFYAKADLLVCQSEIIKEYFYKKNRKTKTHIIKNPINMNAIYTGKRGETTHRIMCVGRLDPQKNFEMVLKAFKLVEGRLGQHRLEFFGEGPSEKNLKLLTDQLGLTNRVRFYGPVTNVFSEKGNADLFIMSSNYEGFPNALVEAMASGIPVISTRFPTGVAESLITEGKNGYLVDINDYSSLAERMVEILEDTDLREKMSENNKQILNVLNLDNVFLCWKEAIGKVLEKE